MGTMELNAVIQLAKEAWHIAVVRPTKPGERSLSISDFNLCFGQLGAVANLSNWFV